MRPRAFGCRPNDVWPRNINFIQTDNIEYHVTRQRIDGYGCRSLEFWMASPRCETYSETCLVMPWGYANEASLWMLKCRKWNSFFIWSINLAEQISRSSLHGTDLARRYLICFSDETIVPSTQCFQLHREYTKVLLNLNKTVDDFLANVCDKRQYFVCPEQWADIEQRI